jgi:phage-related protein
VGNPDGFADAEDRTALLCLHHEHLVALHGFIKKTQTTPDDDLALARKRHKELKR